MLDDRQAVCDETFPTLKSWTSQISDVSVPKQKSDPVFPTHRLHLGGLPRYVSGRKGTFSDTF